MRNGGVNWFEGGRRISKLLIAVVIGIGAIIFFGTSAEHPTFFLEGPSAPWRLEARTCERPNFSQYLFDADLGGSRDTVVLCFEALSNGTIPYAVAPEPEAVAQARKAREAQAAAEDKAAMAHGQPPPLRALELPQKWYYGGRPENEIVSAYIYQQWDGFKLTPERLEQIKESSSKRLWLARRESITAGGPWVVGIVLFIWIATSVIGWIVRGFAGVPRGSDFRTAEPAE